MLLQIKKEVIRNSITHTLDVAPCFELSGNCEANHEPSPGSRSRAIRKNTLFQSNIWSIMTSVHIVTVRRLKVIKNSGFFPHYYILQRACVSLFSK